MPRHILAACVLLAVALGVSCQDSDPSFAAWLAAKQSSAAGKLTAQSSPAYERRQVAHTCLMAGSFKNCRLPETGTVGLEYFEVGAQCCGAHSTMGTAAVDVATCKFNEYYFDDAIQEALGVHKFGEFTVQCNMNAAADTCGHPFCDQMVLSASGGIYYTVDAVIASQPLDPFLEGSCQAKRRRQTTDAIAKLLKRPAAAGGGSGAAGAGAGSKVDGTVKTAGYGYDKPSSHLQSGEALIYFGPMTVNSRVHDIKVTQGWFEFVDYVEVGDPITEEQAEGKHVVDPYTFNLEFYKPQVY